MRSIYLLICISLFVPDSIFCQDLFATHISGNYQNRPLKQVLVEIGKEFDISFSFLDQNVEQYSITAAFESRDPGDILTLILKETNLSYKIYPETNNIVLYINPQKESPQKEKRKVKSVKKNPKLTNNNTPPQKKMPLTQRQIPLKPVMIQTPSEHPFPVLRDQTNPSPYRSFRKKKNRQIPKYRVGMKGSILHTTPARDFGPRSNEYNYYSFVYSREMDSRYFFDVEIGISEFYTSYENFYGYSDYISQFNLWIFHEIEPSNGLFLSSTMNRWFIHNKFIGFSAFTGLRYSTLKYRHTWSQSGADPSEEIITSDSQYGEQNKNRKYWSIPFGVSLHLLPTWYLSLKVDAGYLYAFEEFTEKYPEDEMAILRESVSPFIEIKNPEDFTLSTSGYIFSLTAKIYF